MTPSSVVPPHPSVWQTSRHNPDSEYNTPALSPDIPKSPTLEVTLQSPRFPHLQANNPHYHQHRFHKESTRMHQDKSDNETTFPHNSLYYANKPNNYVADNKTTASLILHL